MNPIPIELLAPAKDLRCGMQAILHGADAIYIGGPAFGARNAASNTIEDISKLIDFAHVFHAKVYVAINTILFENEIEPAVKLIHTLYNKGADAIIIQDVGLLECDLPPIPIHASTQMNNKTVEKIQFLEAVGFSQIVLARELSIPQITEIKKHTQLPLEFFVHGALCVSYSGQCYMSAHATGRSGNRGTCSQMCRHEFVLSGIPEYEQKKGYYLSLNDFHAGNYIEQLLDAGIQSFKIEGRLKDDVYVANTTAFFRKQIDAILQGRTEFIRSSHGHTDIGFVPDIHKTYSRTFSSYFLDTPRTKIANIQSPKSLGEHMGSVTFSKEKTLQFEKSHMCGAGDGICFFIQNKLQGVRVNKVQGDTVFLAEEFHIPIGTDIWRNHNELFSKNIEKTPPKRTISVTLDFRETEFGFSLAIQDCYNNKTQIDVPYTKQKARNSEQCIKTIHTQLQKTGDTIYRVSDVNIVFKTPFFISIADINKARRDICNQLNVIRCKSHPQKKVKIQKNTVPYPTNETLDTRLNCSNSFAESFFKRHGISKIPPAYEISPNSSIPLMHTKYCIRFELNACWKYQGYKTKAHPIFLQDKTGNYRVEFDCKNCEMKIYAT